MIAVAAANNPERPMTARTASTAGDGASSLAHHRLCGGSGSFMGGMLAPERVTRQVAHIILARSPDASKRAYNGLCDRRYGDLANPWQSNQFHYLR
jgi:hypothetical protein